MNLDDLFLLRKVRDRIDREYAQPLNVEALGREVGMSAGHLSRQFRAAYGEPPYSYLMTRRIERAMALLRRGDLSVTEVCFEVGCSSLGTFSTRFSELVGMSPSQYRREESGAVAGMIQFSEELEPLTRHASIDLFVDPALHNRGIGSEAIRRVVDLLVSQRGHHRITIDPALSGGGNIVTGAFYLGSEVAGSGGEGCFAGDACSTPRVFDFTLWLAHSDRAAHGVTVVKGVCCAALSVGTIIVCWHR